MTENNILRFPQPHDDLSPDERAARIAEVAEEVVGILDSGGSPTELRALLSRLESASAKLAELGDLVLRGGDRGQAGAGFAAIRRSIAMAREKLDKIDQTKRVGEREDDS